MVNPELGSAVDALIEGRGDRRAEALVGAGGLDVLPILEPRLGADLPLPELERVEAVLKRALRGLCARSVPGEVAREVAGFQKRLGFLLKYKPYAVKAASPLGYSIFVQTPREGFSFQRHLEHKTEIFHILDVHDGGYVFICEYDDWQRGYEPDAFGAWLAGEPNPRYDAFRATPAPGDVFWVDRLNVVHTVIGCTLEEFATVSTDLVDRLHDQNRGKRIPATFRREWVTAHLRALSPPPRTRRVVIDPAGSRMVEEAPVPMPGGRRTPFIAGDFVAERWMIDPGRATAIRHDDGQAVSAYVMAGRGALILGTPDEVSRSSPPTLDVGPGDLILVLPGAHYGFVNEGGESLTISMHRVPPGQALR
jgi:mannose-6-phosphate isomerase-like protein (cupin superfamily)